MFRKFVLPVMLCLVISASFVACNESVSYAPSAYGEHNHCYYAYDPAEVIALQQAGLCPRTWVAYPMPVYWHAMYYPYYSSPVYYDRYIPAQRRTYYRTTVITKFEREYRTEITRYESKGKWKGSDGKEANGKTVTSEVKSKKATFSSGSTQQSTTRSESKTTQSKTTQSRTTTRSSTTVRTTRSR